MTVPHELLYQSEHILVVHRPLASENALVTFSHAEFRPEGLRFWGDGIAAAIGLNAVGVVATTSNWFPMRDMLQAADAARAAVAGNRGVIGFGSSMGGYGALKHGRRMGTTHALSLAPQWSIDPADVEPWDTRFSVHYKAGVHDSVAIVPGDVSDHAAILYDPFHALDRQNFERIQQAAPTSVGIKCFLAGHGPIGLCSGVKRISRLFALLLEEDYAGLQGWITAERRTAASPLRPYALIRMLLERNTGLAERLTAAHGHKFSVHQRARLHHDLAWVLHNEGRLEDARAQAVLATGLVVDRDMQLRLSRIEMKLGNMRAALTAAEEVARQWPDFVPGRHHLAQLRQEATA